MSATILPATFLGALGPGELWGLVSDSTFFGKFILLVLLVLSVMSWAVVVDKGRLLARIRAGHQEFWESARAWLDNPDAGSAAGSGGLVPRRTPTCPWPASRSRPKG